MKRGLLISLVSGLMLIACLYLCFFSVPRMYGDEHEPEIYFRTENKKIQVRRGDVWEDFEIRGINLGTGYPGVFPNEFGIPQETYRRWLQLIGEMNANTIRVYKMQSPGFYAAFEAYNATHDQKLYLIQGIDFREDLMYTEKSIHDGEVKKEILRHTKEVVDALHGRSLSPDLGSGKLFCYNADVSDYVLGYVLGIEWDEVFVEYSCRLEKGLAPYCGRYVSGTDAANAFESFLSWWGDELLAYETSCYGVQKLLSFANWPETDPLVNEVTVRPGVNEFSENTEALIDLEHLRLSEYVRSGMFASYNIYPYFPAFLQYGEYTYYTDEEGVRNPYRKYLMALTEHHTCPVVVTEYGIPAARSTAYQDIWRGFSQGGSTEREQGEAMARMYRDTQQAGCAGSLIFTWQDEWYKSAWNEKTLSDPNGRAGWCNAQCVEQFYGLLAFEPKSGEDFVYPDGDIAEWRPSDVIVERETLSLSIRCDEKYLHFMVRGTDKSETAEGICLALDVLPGIGATQSGGRTFDKAVDFLICIDKDGDGKLLVHRDADIRVFSGAIDNKKPILYELQAGEEELLAATGSEDVTFRVVTRASGSINQFLAARIPYAAVGILREGNANPNYTEYDSNADFFRGDGLVEIRIPWQLLNFYDPSACLVIDDYRKNGYQIRGRKIDNIYAAVYYDDEREITDFGSFRMQGWRSPDWQERLKESYYIMKEVFDEP